MITIKIQIPKDMELDLLSFVEKIGGEVISVETIEEETVDDEVTHNSFFGENIKRAIRAFKL